MPEALKFGSRVRVRRDGAFPGPWPSEPQGTVQPWPDDEALFHIVHHDWGGDSIQRAFWIVFDEPQRDTDGDGPYRKGSVWERYLEPL
jgi:hypothetical protein